MLKYEKAVLQNTIDTKLTGMYNSKLTVADGCTIDVSKSDFYPTSDAIEKNKSNRQWTVIHMEL